jgi:hypothetical protein
MILSRRATLIKPLNRLADSFGVVVAGRSVTHELAEGIDLDDLQTQGDLNENDDDVGGWVNERDKFSYKES